jgi:Domain of unknown function (DUF397)
MAVGRRAARLGGEPAPLLVVGVRDSKDPRGEALVFTAHAWRAFIDRVKSGKLG